MGCGDQIKTRYMILTTGLKINVILDNLGYQGHFCRTFHVIFLFQLEKFNLTDSDTNVHNVPHKSDTMLNMCFSEENVFVVRKGRTEATWLL